MTTPEQVQLAVSGVLAFLGSFFGQKVTDARIHRVVLDVLRSLGLVK